MNKGHCEICGKTGKLYHSYDPNRCVRDSLGDPMPYEKIVCKECFDEDEKRPIIRQEITEKDIKNLPF